MVAYFSLPDAGSLFNAVTSAALLNSCEVSTMTAKECVALYPTAFLRSKEKVDASLERVDVAGLSVAVSSVYLNEVTFSRKSDVVKSC